MPSPKVYHATVTVTYKILRNRSTIAQFKTKRNLTYPYVKNYVDFRKDKQLFLTLEIGGALVERVKSARLLAGTRYSIMKWNEHVNKI